MMIRMELKFCKKHNQMTNHEEDYDGSWYCIKCILEKPDGN